LLEILLVKLLDFFILFFIKIISISLFMENIASEDLGEEILFKLEELNRILGKLIQEFENAEKFASACCCDNRIS